MLQITRPSATPDQRRWVGSLVGWRCITEATFPSAAGEPGATLVEAINSLPDADQHARRRSIRSRIFVLTRTARDPPMCQLTGMSTASMKGHSAIRVEGLI